MTELKEALERAPKSNIDVRDHLKSGLYEKALNVPEFNRPEQHNPTKEAVKVFENTIDVLQKARSSLPVYHS